MLFLNLSLSFLIILFLIQSLFIYSTSTGPSLAELQFLQFDASNVDFSTSFFTESEGEDKDYIWGSRSSHRKAMERSKQTLQEITDILLPDHLLTHPYSYSLFSKTMNRGSLPTSNSFIQLFYLNSENEFQTESTKKDFESDSFQNLEGMEAQLNSKSLLGQMIKNNRGDYFGAHLINSNQLSHYDEVINKLESANKVTQVSDNNINKFNSEAYSETHPVLSLILNAHKDEESLMKLLENECDSYTKDYWSYEYCFRKNVRQFHIERLSDNQIKMEPNWSLGSFSFEINEENIKSSDDSFHMSGYSPNLLIQHFEGGQMCYEIDAPRSTRVLLQCCDHLNLPLTLHSNNFYYYYQDKYSKTQSSSKNKSPNFKFLNINKVEEVSQCKYEISVCSPLLCTPPSSLTSNVPKTSDDSFTSTNIDASSLYEEVLPSFPESKKRVIQTKNQIIAEFLSNYSKTIHQTSKINYSPINFFFNSNFLIFFDINSNQIYSYNMIYNNKNLSNMNLSLIKKDKILLQNFLNNLYYFSKKKYQIVLSKLLIKKLNKICLIYPKDWWTYEVCLNGKVKQMRLSTAPTTLPDGKIIQKQVVESEFSLGQRGKEHSLYDVKFKEDMGPKNNPKIKHDPLEEITDEEANKFLLNLKFKSFYRIIPVEVSYSENQSEETLNFGSNSNLFYNLGFISPLFEGTNTIFSNLPFTSLPSNSTFEQTLFDSLDSDSYRSLPPFPHTTNQLTLSFTDGTPCDLLNIPRSSKVHLRCGTHDRIISVTETSTCKYEIEAELLVLCGFPSFKPLDIEDSSRIVFTDLQILTKELEKVTDKKDTKMDDIDKKNEFQDQLIESKNGSPFENIHSSHGQENAIDVLGEDSMERLESQQMIDKVIDSDSLICENSESSVCVGSSTNSKHGEL